MKKILFLVCLSVLGKAQTTDTLFSASKIQSIIKVLASDDMKGREIFTPEIDSAAAFIASRFQKTGLTPYTSDSYFQTFSYERYPQGTLTNVIGILEGKSRKNEYVIFSAHYDHLGMRSPQMGTDSIYNGANDDASGVAAVLLLAEYFKKLNQNERTLIFVCFTGEEEGGLGSRYFSKQYDPNQITAMFNIEMIGTDSKWGKNSAFITGYKKSDFGTILQKNLSGTPFSFYPDPYRKEKLFYRSDNATLAYLGVPAHTISTSKMDNEPYYHQVNDEIDTLDLSNMSEIVKAIALSAQSIISGVDTPTRINE
ncbi:M20/M25/M40 family metallo-hydrolase [Apibacter raozihei]|uniref:M28 family metallopeptidase n=1 Tax=Apibacter raozihei TaxID=2500547 RepID=UPI000FE3B598|nr:M20/M25/M40 family metallo-hydrolase [Apibacter raozihei]